MIQSIAAPVAGAAGAQSMAGGRAAFPVAPESVLYARFEHVSGVPAPEGTRGVPVSKLKIMDVMIDRLRQIREDKPALNPAEYARDDARRMDALIERLKAQIDARSALAAALPYRPNPAIAPGSFFNIGF